MCILTKLSVLKNISTVWNLQVKCRLERHLKQQEQLVKKVETPL